MAGNPVKEDTFRTFLALPLSEHFLEELKALIQQLQTKIQGVKWVLPEQVHVTLHFFGKTSPQEIETIEKLVTPLVVKYPPLHLALAGVGFFPNPSRPRVIWVGVSGETAILIQLQNEIEKALGGAGFPLEERTFFPHATVGRVKDGRGQQRFHLEGIPLLKTEPRRIEKFILFQSLLGPQGARYEVLKTFCLSAKPGS